MSSGVDRVVRYPAPVAPGISDSVRINSGGLLFVSGAIGIESDGTFPTEFERGVERAFEIMTASLKTAGASLSDVVKLNVYIVGLSIERFATYRDVRDRFIDASNLPASSVVGIESLYGSALIEIDAIASAG